jgi:hypothetical protein
MTNTPRRRGLVKSLFVPSLQQSRAALRVGLGQQVPALVLVSKRSRVRSFRRPANSGCEDNVVMRELGVGTAGLPPDPCRATRKPGEDSEP